MNSYWKNLLEKIDSKIEAECISWENRFPTAQQMEYTELIMPKKIFIGGQMDSGQEFYGKCTMLREKMCTESGLKR